MNTDTARLVKFIETFTVKNIINAHHYVKEVSVTNSNGMHEWESTVGRIFGTVEFEYATSVDIALKVVVTYTYDTGSNVNAVTLDRVIASVKSESVILNADAFSITFRERLYEMISDVRIRDSATVLIDAIGGLPNGF